MKFSIGVDIRTEGWDSMWKVSKRVKITFEDSYQYGGTWKSKKK